MTGDKAAIEVVPLTTEWRRACAALEVRPDQRRFVSPISDYLALCERADSPWRPFAVVLEGEVAGFVMHGIDPADGSAWIGGLVIDRAFQRLGIGRAVVDALVARAATEGRASALSYDPENLGARALYLAAGFVETGEIEDGEVVARRPL